HRYANRLEILHLGVDHAQDDVEVVNHQIEDDIDVGAALAEGRQAVTLDETRLRENAGKRADGRIEAFEVPDLQNALVPFGHLDQALPVGNRLGHWLFDQDIDSLGEKIVRQRGMHGCRNGEADTVDTTEQGTMVAECGRPATVGYRSGALPVG